MTADAAVTREALFQTVAEQWQATEDAMAGGGRGSSTRQPTSSGRWETSSATITASNHDTASQIRALLASGEFPFTGDEGNAAGIEKFRSLDYKMLRIELNTAHGVVWMYIQRFSDDDPRADALADGLGDVTRPDSRTARAARGRACG